MAESDSDQSTLLSFIGLLIGTFAYGALLTLGLLCFVQLNLGPRGTNSDWSCSSLQKRLFQVYIILLSIANTIFEVKNARTLGIILLQRPNPTPAGHLLVTPMDIVVAFVAILADGLLVSPCAFSISWEELFIYLHGGLAVLHGSKGAERATFHFTLVESELDISFMPLTDRGRYV